MRAVIDGKFVQAATCLTILILPNSLGLAKSVVSIVIIVHYCLQLPLIVVACYLGDRLAVLVPEAVDGALACSLFSLGVLS